MNVTHDSDPEETREWLEALKAAVASGGRDRGLFLLTQLEQQAQQLGVVAHVMPYSAYQNTVPLAEQAVHPGDVALEERLTAIMRWNALAMVVRNGLRGVGDTKWILGITVFATVCIIVFNLVVDIVYAWFDPRIRLS